MNIEKLKQIVESVGCEMKQYCTEFFIMLPIKFPGMARTAMNMNARTAESLHK